MIEAVKEESIQSTALTTRTPILVQTISEIASSNHAGKTSIQQIIELFPFQRIGVDFFLANTRALNCDEVGLGKTFQALEAVRVISEASDKMNVLIVCPASLCLMWGTECKNYFMKQCTQQFKDVHIVYMKEQKETIELKTKLRFVICSYNYLQKPVNVRRLKKVNWDAIIADEAAGIKNYLSKTCKGFVELIKEHKEKVWLMTATPATRSGADYYPYLEIIQPGKWGNFYQFREMFCNLKYSMGYKSYEGVKESKKGILRLAFSKIMIRRRKIDVLKELPAVLSKYLPVEISSDIVSACLALDVEMVRGILEKGLVLPAHIASVVRSIGMGKVEVAAEFILNCGEPIVVFCSHVDVVGKLEELLLANERRCVTITGSDTAIQKHKAVSEFQSGGCDVVLCNIKAGGVGITLHRAAQVLFVELDWSPAVMEQACGRVLRIGQKAACVNITYLVGYRTIDETVLEVLLSKSTFMKDVMGDR